MSINSNMTVLITGASSGLGKETAKKMVAEGYTVYTAARQVNCMDDLKTLGCIPLKMDITKEDDVVAVVERIEQDRGGVDILVNNAGIGMMGAVEETTLEDARYQFEVNLFGLARLTQLVLPYMRQQKAGKILNVTSIGGKVYGPLSAWYIGSKHALEGWSDCLRVETKPFGIDVIIVEPGGMTTGFNGFIEPMLERSGQGPYGKIANKLADWVEQEAKNSSYSSVSIVANVILKAIKSKHPKTRYVVGKLAKPMLFARKWLSDRVFDRLIMSVVN